MNILHGILKMHRLIFGPMPLNEFNDYDEYWRRRRGTITDAILHRYIWVAKRMEKDSSVLDIGCGDGAFLRYLKENGEGRALFGVDVSREAIEALSVSGIQGALLENGARIKDLVDRSFDYVILMEVIEHVHDAEGLFRQALELGSKSIFVTIPNTGYFIHRLRLGFGGRFPVTTILYHITAVQLRA